MRATQICGGISWPHPSRRAQSRASPAITAKPLRRDEEIVPHAEEHGESRASRSTRARSFTTLRRLGGGFGLRLALLARHGLFRIVARLALGDTGGIEEARHAIRRLGAL